MLALLALPLQLPSPGAAVRSTAIVTTGKDSSSLLPLPVLLMAQATVNTLLSCMLFRYVWDESQEARAAGDPPANLEYGKTRQVMLMGWRIILLSTALIWVGQQAGRPSLPGAVDPLVPAAAEYWQERFPDQTRGYLRTREMNPTGFHHPAEARRTIGLAREDTQARVDYAWMAGGR